MSRRRSHGSLIVCVVVALLGSAVARGQANPSAPRCASSETGTSFCLRLVSLAAPGQLRVVTAVASASPSPAALPQTVTATLDGKAQSPLNLAAFNEQPLPLDVLMVVQANETFTQKDFLDRLLALAESLYLIPSSRIGLVIYHRNKQKDRFPLERSKTEVMRALAQIQVHAGDDQASSFSTSDALDTALNLLEEKRGSELRQRLVILATDGEDENVSSAAKEIFGRRASSALHLGASVDMLWRGTRHTPQPYLEDLCARTGGILWFAKTNEELGMLVQQEGQQAIYQQQVLDLQLSRPATVPATGGSSQQRLRLSAEAYKLALEETVELTWSAESGSDPIAKHAAKSLPGWFWIGLLATLVATCLSSLAFPAVRVALKWAFGPLPVVRALPAGTVTPLSTELLPPPGALLPARTTRQLSRTPRPPRVATWHGHFQQGRPMLAWLVALHSGRVYILDRNDVSLGNDLSYDLVIAGAKLAPFGCRLVREPQSQRLAIYPLGELSVEYQGRLLTSPVYLSDQDELSIGPHRFAYFETNLLC